MTTQPSLADIEQFIAGKDWWKLKEYLKHLPAVEIAELLEDMDPQPAVVVFRLLVKPKAADVFSYLSYNKGIELLKTFSTKQLSDVMDNLEPDDRVAFMEELPGHLTLTILNVLKPENREQVQKLLGYPEESVGRLMTTKFVRLKSDWTIERSMTHIRVYGKQAETLNVIYVVDEKGKLIDDLRIQQLILAEPHLKVADVMDHTFQALSAFDDQEAAVKMFSKYDRVALPVVDSDGVLIGIVTVDDVMDVAEEEATEDMQLMGGMNALDDDYSQTGVLEMVRKRVGWLIMLFLGQMLTVTALASFEGALATAAILAFFVPMIISSGGNSGSQAATLIIRALSTDDIQLIDWKKVLGRELVSGLWLGGIIGILGSGVIACWMMLRGEPFSLSLVLQALTVGTSLIGVVIFGNLSGAMLPFLMSKLGLDPAVTSAPFVATLVDVTGILIYFSVASILLRGVVL
ncbi:MAG: magnesium transporter [Saprospiraceae bacterium]|nr:magnesium transporter [Saprospiraceae bacterium]